MVWTHLYNIPELKLKYGDRHPTFNCFIWMNNERTFWDNRDIYFDWVIGYGFVRTDQTIYLTPMYINIAQYQQTTEESPKSLTAHLVCYFIHTGTNANSSFLCVCLFTLPTVCLDMMECQKHMLQ